MELVENNVYISPEQFDGERRSEASDVWALGVVLLQLALGKNLEPMGKSIRKDSVLA